ncbi:MAG: transcriptional regulator GlxA family with amidase domain [Sulfitobacter sp.]|jgi:transcriptional regulator GlxA family with amidase domain
MQNWKKSEAEPIQIGLLLFDGFSNHCVANMIEPLRAANMLGQQRYYRWRYLTVTGAVAQSSSGLNIVPEAALSEARGDLLLVAPSYGFRTLTGPSVIRGLRAAARRFDRIAGLDTGAWLLAEAGLLDGHRATIHPEELTALAEEFPKIEVERARYVMDGTRITCSGAMAAFDLALQMVVQGQGAALALAVEQLFVTRDATSVPVAPVVGRGRLVRAAIAVMNAHLEQPLTILEIAGVLGCKQRRLEAAFLAETTLTPQGVYRRQRLILARKLAETTSLPLTEVAMRAGYRTPSAMSRAFKGAFDLTPSEARQSAQR